MGLVFVFIGIIFIVSSIIVSIFVNKKEISAGIKLDDVSEVYHNWEE